MGGLLLYFTREQIEDFRSSYFWETGHFPDGDELLSWLIDKGYF